MMISHPTFRRLRRFALGEASGRESGRIARHLEACAGCQARVRGIREVVAAAREETVRAPVGFESIAARIESGERVIPLAGPASERRAWRDRGTVVAAALVFLVVSAIVLNVPAARADISELWVSPAEPTAGEALTLRYQATSRLRDSERLVVRARFYEAGSREDPRTEVIGELPARRGGRFEGTVMLPATAVYAVLAVEDSDASFVDSHAERWEVVLHDSDGRPLLDALRARMMDNRMRNTRVASEAIRAMTENYPDHLEGWYVRWSDEGSRLPREAQDSLRALYRPEVERIAAAAETAIPGPTELWYLARFADLGGERWREELERRHPGTRGALQQAAFAASSRHRDDPPRYLAALDSIWRIAPDSASQAAFSAWTVVQQAGDAAGMLEWGMRLAAAQPDLTWYIGDMLSRREATRGEGVAMIRKAIAGLEDPSRERPLTMSREEDEAASRRVAARYFASLGRALLEAGHTEEARDALDRAVAGVWDPTVFQAAADARLMLGDTASAIQLVARVAADPTTEPDRTDSLRVSLGDAAGPDDVWGAALEQARAEMRRELLEEALNRAPLRTRLRLEDPAGRSHDVRLGEGPVTVVAFWSRYCPPSREQLAELDDVAVRLREQGVRFLAITDEENADEVTEFMTESGYAFSTYLDPERHARNAFDNRSVPHYFVLDTEGRIRFTARAPSDVVRQVAVLTDS
jgi:hypothetical protein